MYPGLRGNTLVSLAAYRAAFPAIPGMTPPTVQNTRDVIDFGPLFDTEGGVQTLLPPIVERRYPVLVPRPDADGVGEGLALPAVRDPDAEQVAQGGGEVDVVQQGIAAALAGRETVGDAGPVNDQRQPVHRLVRQPVLGVGAVLAE